MKLMLISSYGFVGLNPLYNKIGRALGNLLATIDILQKQKVAEENMRRHVVNRLFLSKEASLVDAT